MLSSMRLETQNARLSGKMERHKQCVYYASVPCKMLQQGQGPSSLFCASIRGRRQKRRTLHRAGFYILCILLIVLETIAALPLFPDKISPPTSRKIENIAHSFEELLCISSRTKCLSGAQRRPASRAWQKSSPRRSDTCLLYSPLAGT